jgi:hypothetical protein
LKETTMRIATIAVATILAAAPATAHEMKVLGPEGGQLAHVGANHYELVPGPGGARLYIYDANNANRPVDASRARATARVVVGGQMAKASFTPTGGNMLSAAGLRLAGDWTVIVQAGLAPAKPAVAVRFSARGMAAQAKASPAKADPHVGH